MATAEKIEKPDLNEAVLCAFLDEPCMVKRPFVSIGDKIAGHFVSASYMTLPPDEHGILKDVPTIRWVQRLGPSFGVFGAFLPKGAVSAMVNGHAFYSLQPGSPFELTFSGSRPTKSGHDAKLFKFRALGHVGPALLTEESAELAKLLFASSKEFAKRHRCHWLEGQSVAIAALSPPAEELAD